MRVLKVIGLTLAMFLGLLTIACAQLTQTDTSKIYEAKTNLINFLNLSCSMLSESTGYKVEYDEIGDGNPIDLKYTFEKKLICLTKASEYYIKVASYYTVISESLTQDQKDEFQLIDNKLYQITNDADYKKLISKPILPSNEIFPVITFFEILKTKVEDFGKGILK